MKLTTTYLAEHHSSGDQDLLYGVLMGADVLAPGACTCSFGSSTTSCCCYPPPAHAPA